MGFGMSGMRWGVWSFAKQNMRGTAGRVLCFKCSKVAAAGEIRRRKALKLSEKDGMGRKVRANCAAYTEDSFRSSWRRTDPTFSDRLKYHERYL